MSTPKRSLVAHSAFAFIGNALSAVLSLIYVSVSARMLGLEKYGAVGAAVSFASLFMLALVPLEAGATLAVAGFSGRGQLAELSAFSRMALRGLTGLAVGFALAWGLLVLGFSEALALGSRDAGLWLGLFICAALICCGPRAALRGRESFSALSLNLVLESALRAAIGLSLLWFTGRPGAVIGGYALGATLSIVHSQRAARAGLPVAPRSQRALLEDVRSVLGTVSAPLIGLQVYYVLSSNLDVLTAARFLSNEQAGLYAGAASLSRMVPSAASPLLLVVFSRLASQSAARESTGGTLRLASLVVGGALLGSLLVPTLAGELVLRLSLGERFVAGQPLLAYQWATACVLVAQSFAAESLLATARVRASWLFALPVVVLAAVLWSWHDTPLAIARGTFLSCASCGTAMCVLLWRLRRAH